MRCFYVIVIFYLATLTSGDEPKIVIIGAGASGIAAASKLFENGFTNVTILEAEDRIGGRVHTIKFDGSLIDLGGQWVHGQTDNTVFQLAWPLGVLEVPEETSINAANVYTSKGFHIPDSIGINLLNTYEEVYSDVPESVEKNSSIGEYLERMMNIELQKYPTVNETLGKSFMKLFEGFLMSSEASDNWNEVSVMGQFESWVCAGSNIVNWKKRGYGTILDILMKKFPNPEEELPVLNNTLLNSEVVNVDYQSTEGKALVETGSGDKFTADHIIVTSSLGVLKEQYETLFTPQLPETKVNTIKGLAFGTAAKIYLSFETIWWPHDFIFVWDEDDRQEYESNPTKKWLVDILGVFTDSHKPRVLYAWLGGASSRYMETLPEDQVLHDVSNLLNKFLGKSYNVTRLIGIKRTTWYSNKHFRGTYSFRSMETERADAWPDQLAAPLLVNDKPIVLFAGEATDSHYYGNVHGAIDAGFREANRLIEIYKNTTK